MAEINKIQPMGDSNQYDLDAIMMHPIGINTENDITLTKKTSVYTGNGSGWNGSINTMQYAAILQISNGDLTRSWQIWNSRGNTSLYWRNPNSDATAWNNQRAIIDDNNYTNYTVTKTGSGASGTWGISITGNAATATKISSTPNNTTTFLRGDNTWSNTITGPLYINNSSDAELSSQGSGALVIGSKTSTNISIDDNEIMARNNTSTATLYLQANGGNVSCGGAISATSFNGTATSASSLSSRMRIATTGEWLTANASASWRRVALLTGTRTGRNFLAILYSSYNSPHDFSAIFSISCGYNEAGITMLSNSGSLAQFNSARLVRQSSSGTSNYFLEFYYCGASQYNNGPVCDIISFDNTTITTYAFTATSSAGPADCTLTLHGKSLCAPSVWGAVWNDYAEMRNVPEAQIKNAILKPGMCIKETGNGEMIKTEKRLERGCKIISDTFGFNIGETDECKTPIAVSGRALVYIYEGRDKAASHIGWPVCSGPDGTVSIMTEEEEEKYSSRIVGTISEIPNYDTWGTGNVSVDGRIWIYVR